MTRGFAFVAYPAEYRSSGVMTFIVSQEGIVYEKDLGPATSQLAKTIARVQSRRNLAEGGLILIGKKAQRTVELVMVLCAGLNSYLASLA